MFKAERKVSCERQRAGNLGHRACIFSSTRFVSHLSDRQFLRLDNFHIPRILDIEAFLWLLPHSMCMRVCAHEYIVGARSRRATILHVSCTRAQERASVSPLLGTYTCSERDLSQEGGRERRLVNAFRESIIGTPNIIIILLAVRSHYAPFYGRAAVITIIFLRFFSL